MADRVDFESFTSQAAGQGTSGYWSIPDIQVRWAFEAGLPDPQTFPIDDLVRISERILRTDAADGLQYGGGAHGSIMYGYEGLRDRLAERTIARDDRSVDRRGILLTSGGVQGISLVCDAFLDPGDVVVVEAPTWGAVLASLRRRGGEPVAIPLDADGMRLDVLEQRLRELAAAGRRVKLVYTIATFHTPTGVCLSLERRRRLIELASQHDFLILEDNVYGDLRYTGDPIPTIFALDDSDRVIRVDSLSKVLAPALRLGWVTGHPDAIGALSAVRGDLGVSQWIARIAAAFLEEGLLDPHIARVNELYRRKLEVAHKALQEHCSAHVSWNAPEGGYFLWCELAEGIDGREVMKRAIAQGVVCRPGERFFGEQDPGRQFFRLAFIMVPIAEIERGIAALGRAIVESAGT